ncbi:MAG TPA: SRPBCC domain-containing protein [Chthoniobacterales bacterium]
MGSIRHQVSIRVPATDLYHAISTETGIGSWWDKPDTVRSEAGTVLEFRPGPGHGVLKMKVLINTRDRHVEWECISTHAKSSPASAWTGTHVIFEISEQDGTSVLNFRHTGWDEDNEYFAFCNYNWGVALQKLKLHCESRNS